MGYIHFRVDDDFKKILQKKASEKGLSLNSYIRMVLIENCK